jgi:hypothetical protein
VNELIEGFALIGLSFVLGGLAMRARAWAASRGGDSAIARQMETDALRYARVAFRIGIPVSIVGLLGWLLMNVWS